MRAAPILTLCVFAGLLQGCLLPEGASARTQPALPQSPIHWADGVVEDLATDWPDDHRRPFLRAVAPVAMRSGAEHCVPPSVTVAQAVLESGWGRSDNATEHNNLFGIKAAPKEVGVRTRTWEVVGGERRNTTARFRIFESWSDAVRQHDRRLAEHPAYEAARAVRSDWKPFVEALAPVYATDPNYATRLRKLVRTYKLDALDGPALARAEAKGHCG